MSDNAWLERLSRAIVKPPYHDGAGHKGWLERFSRAQPHAVRSVSLRVEGWPRWSRPLRILFLSDFHVGSHTDDVVRLRAIVTEAADHRPDLILLGGDFVNMMPFGGGRVPPHVVASILTGMRAPCGRIAVLGNHDRVYDANAVALALRTHDFVVLDDEIKTIRFEGVAIDILGIPDAHVSRPNTQAVLARLSGQRPTIVLAHDPAWFAHVPPGPHLTLAGHTHGGQIRFPGIGVLRNASEAPLRWTYGHVIEDGKHLYVTSGLGTSGIPLRIGVPPEIVVIDLSGA